MKIIKKIRRAFTRPQLVALFILDRLSPLFSDELFLKLKFYLTMDYRLDLNNPKTFSEKLQWLKLHDRKPEYVTMVDKYAVKQYVANKIGDEYIIPTLGVWNKFDDIDFDKLPNQFVLKCTHDSGGLVICNDKSKLNKNEARHKIEVSMKRNYFHMFKEWPYKSVPKRIIAEQYMTDGKSSDLPDYKFFCFDGEPKYCQVIRDRRSKETIDFYDMEWNHMPFVGLNPVASNGLSPVAKPAHLDKMIEICRKLSEGNPFSRIDLYVINDKEYFGEITFYPAGGMGVFRPDEWNKRLGDLINLPNAIGGVNLDA